MKIKTLESFKLSDAVKFHYDLNPKLWRGNRLDPAVRKQLIVIAKDFLTELGVKDLAVEDITISGSNAAYSYTPHSDLDLHLVVDMSKLPNDEIYKELFNAKKILYNDSHDIKIKGIPIELYVQDSKQVHHSLGEYSLLQNKWLRIPKKERANFDQRASKAKYDKLNDLVTRALRFKKSEQVDKALKIIKQYRQAGLDKGGEFSPENLAFKAIRKQGFIQDLYKLRDELHSKELSIENMYAQEDYHPNAKPRGPEFPPTMPAGTVRVDVSDVYDWYKLGQHISNLKGLGTHDFGKGPPSTIMAFGSEPEEHKYIQDLEKTGLTTTDIDPYDPKQPKGMKRQKTDPTYNVNEAFDQPYKLKWYPGDWDEVTAYADMPDGDDLTIMFNNDENEEGEEAWSVEFYRNDSQEVTGEGDAQRIFATVLVAIKTFIKKYKPNRLIFSASKEVGPGQKSQSRANLYDRLVQRYARTMGYRAFRADAGNKVHYELNKIKKSVSEASGYIPSEKEKNDPRFKTALTVDVKPDSIKKNAKAFGFKVKRNGVPPPLRP